MSDNIRLIHREALSTNTLTSATPTLNIWDASVVGFSVIGKTGGNTTLETALQVSYDGSSWQSTTHTLIGTGLKEGLRIAAPKARLKVTTMNGVAGTADFILAAK